ncbi:hypothetical protein BJY04DRAFT_35223 [Aspergillus karnatakaensis]|uniref:uncharacterized protein n=1 Tax=Aspergillus karnatakaensis TaxID=1810916 RepID=UPI003CCDFA3C
MAQIQESLPSRPLGPGCELRFFTKPDDTLPPPSRQYYTETTYDGAADSQLLEIPLHWHKHHDEYMQIISGSAHLTLDNHTTLLQAGSHDPIFIPRRHRHGLKCLPGVPMVMREWTTPNGMFKEWFFRDTFKFGNPPPVLHALRAFWDGDTYLALPVGVRVLDEAFMLVFGGLAKMIAPAKTVPTTRAGGA